MAGDLGRDASEVHERAREALAFWFALPPEQWFATDPALDSEIAARFGSLVDEVISSDAAGLWSEPDDALAAVVIVDQFSRNIFRGQAKAFAGDPLARWSSLCAIGRGWDDCYPADRRAFVYLPLMHAEDRALQALSFAKYEALGRPENLEFARKHAAVIERFGRFPSRNAALGRESTAAEEAFLASEGPGW